MSWEVAFLIVLLGIAILLMAIHDRLVDIKEAIINYHAKTKEPNNKEHQ